MMISYLRWSLLTLTLSLSQCEESTVPTHSLPALSNENQEPKEAPPVVFLTVVIDIYIIEPSGAVSHEGELLVVAESDFEKKFHRKLDDLDKVSLQKRGYVKHVIFRIRGTF